MLKIKKFCALLVFRDYVWKFFISSMAAMFVISIMQRIGILTQSQGDMLVTWMMVLVASMMPAAFVGVFNLDVLDEYQRSRAEQIGEKFPEFAERLNVLLGGRKDHLDAWLKEYDSGKYEELSKKREELRKTVADAPRNLKEVESKLQQIEADLMKS